MASRPPRPRQPVDDVLGAADPFAGGTEEVLSYLHGVAVANQSDDADTGPLMVPVAFAARVSNKDSQDPTLSIPRQLARCREALPPYCVIVAFFWDVESGRLDLDLRGHGDAHELFDVSVPRDGGIADLLDEARRPGRRFVAVVCESVDRLSRVTYFGTKIEYELEQSGVALLAADEGISAESLPSASGKPARKRATPILTRRVKQAIAEWYVIDMLEKSWGGLMEHTEQGFNIGKPPYGYQVVVERHPVPAKAALGKVKRRLVRDPVRGPVVTQIFRWRVVERLSYDEIADRLNLDPDRYPPPEPILGRGRRAIGAWTKGSVRDVLANPKYTGHMVYNRRKNPRRDRGVAGKVNPPSEWIWSSKPRHEPLTTKAMYDAGTPIGKSKKGSRTSDQPNSHPATTRTYRLRSFVICELCGRRLYGKTRRIASGYSYYACEAVPAHHAGKDWFDTHPKSLWVREDKLLDLVRAFFARRIFGPDRAELLASAHGDEAVIEDGTASRAAAVRGKIKDLERQQANVVKELREYRATGDDDLDQEWRGQLRDSFAEITNQRKALQVQLAEITKTPHATATADPRLLDQLPIIEVDFGRLPEDLERELFGGFQLQVRYHQPSRRVTLRVTIDGEVIPQLAAMGRAIMAARGLATQPRNTKSRPPTASAIGGRNGFSLAGRAPGPTRTCASVVDRPADAGVQIRRLDGALLDEAAARLGVDLGDGDQVMDLVAVAATRLAWRDGPVETWHAVPHCRIGDTEMMRANAATTRLLRMILDGAGPEPVDDHNRAVDPLFAAVGRALTDRDRPLPDGRTIAELAPDVVQLAAFDRHVWMVCTGWSSVAAEYGAQQVMALLAVYAGRYCWRWWLAPGWPDVVGEFVRRLDEPSRWRDPEMVRLVTGVGVPDIGGGELHDLLLAGPDRLTPTAAAQCLRAGLGDLLPQDCGRPGLPRHPLPPQYLRLVALPDVWNPGPT